MARGYRGSWKIVHFLILVGLLAGGTAAHAQAPAWAQVSGLPNTIALNNVFMVDRNTAWAVGSESGAGVVFRLSLQDGRWNTAREASFPQGALNGLAVVAAD